MFLLKMQDNNSYTAKIELNGLVPYCVATNFRNTVSIQPLLFLGVAPQAFRPASVFLGGLVLVPVGREKQ